MPNDSLTTTQEGAKAAAAFQRYVALGPGRTLRELAERDAQHGFYKNSSSALRVYAKWSSDHHWQDRLAQAASAQSERMLEEASELDADTFLLTSQLLNERVKLSTPMMSDAVVKLRESVRKPAPKGSTSVNVKVSVEVRQLAEQLADRLGMSADDLIADAERIASGVWGDS